MVCLDCLGKIMVILNVQVSENTKNIGVLKDLFGKTNKRIDNVELKQNKQGGQMTVIIDNNKKVIEALDKINKKIPDSIWRRLKFWHYILVFLAFITIREMLK